MSRRTENPVSVLIIATPDFNLAATTAFIDPFRAANYLEGQSLFRWRMVSPSGGHLPKFDLALALSKSVLIEALSYLLLSSL